MSKVTEWKIRDQKVAVEVDHLGNFSATVDDVTLEAKTLVELKPKVEKAIKRMIDNENPKKQIAITVLGMVLTKSQHDPLAKGVGVVHARLRGKHQRNHEYLFTAEAGPKFKLRSWGNQHVTKRLNAGQEAEYLQLAMARFEKAHEISMDRLLGEEED